VTDPLVPGVVAAVEEVRGRIAAAAARAGRDPAAVTLVAATKTVDVARVAAAVGAGVVDLGENRAQELVAKAPAPQLTGARVRWHFLGRLQRNKVRMLAPWVSCWQSVDRRELGEAIAHRVPGARILVEVDLAGEPAKGGCTPADAPGLADRLRDLGLDVAGLMAVPPAGDDPRPWFARLRDLGSRLGVAELSMGMSGDYEAAVEEGATMVRVGRALFGDRPASPG
jgi:pyridoxal phosphate enzyme (YggS family)